jgi:hypothetical protein
VGRVGVIGVLVGLEFLVFNFCNNVFGVVAVPWTAVLKLPILYNYIEK